MPIVYPSGCSRYETQFDREFTPAFFRQVHGIDSGQGFDKGRLPMIHMPGCADQNHRASQFIDGLLQFREVFGKKCPYIDMEGIALNVSQDRNGPRRKPLLQCLTAAA